MALGLLVKDTTDMIYFDAVENFDRSYTSQVSEHPIDGSGSITDHVTKENPTFSFRGVVSNSDFHTTRPLGLNGLSIKNHSPLTVSVSVGSNPAAKLMNLLPDTIGQFIGDSTPDVTMGEQSGDSVKAIQDALIAIWENKSQLALIEFNGGSIVDNVNFDSSAFIMTSLTFSENPETGDALEVDITLRRIRFVELKSVTIDKKKVSPSIKDKASATSDKGKQEGSTTTTPKGVQDTSPLRKVTDTLLK